MNNSVEGAIAEFSFHNPGVKASVLKVEYKKGVDATTSVAPTKYVNTHPLNVDSITAPSLRSPGTLNTNILNGTANPVRVIE